MTLRVCDGCATKKGYRVRVCDGVGACFYCGTRTCSLWTRYDPARMCVKILLVIAIWLIVRYLVL